MKRSIPDVPFSEGDLYPCDLVALDAMLQFHGYATPLVMHDQWFFAYTSDSHRKGWLSPRFSPPEKDLTDWGIETTHHQEPGRRAAWQRVREQIDRGSPVPVLTDTHHLEPLYYPGWGNHSGHAVIICGYDDASRTVDLVDPSPSKRYRGAVPLSGLLDAWGSNAIPPYTWMEFRAPKPPPAFTAEHAARSVWRNAHLMEGSLRGPDHGAVGLPALRLLADDLAEWVHLEAGEAKSRLKDLYDRLRPVARERQGHAAYLRLAGERLGIGNLTRAGRLIGTIAQKWLVLRNLCLKAQKRPVAFAREKLPNRLNEIVCLEGQALMQLRERLKRPCLSG